MGVVAEAAGSIWLTLLDAVTGFNHIVNTPRARRMLAIVSRSGQFLPRCLTFGPMNGPEDFCYVVDRFYAPGSRSKRRFCREWLSYVDDQTIRTGRVLDGVWLSDEEHEERLRLAAKAADRSAVQSAQEALEAQGFLPHKLGTELQKNVEQGRPAAVDDVRLPEQKDNTSTSTRSFKPQGSSVPAVGLVNSCVSVAIFPQVGDRAACQGVGCAVSQVVEVEECSRGVLVAMPPASSARPDRERQRSRRRESGRSRRDADDRGRSRRRTTEQDEPKERSSAEACAGDAEG